jgi:hypothetical protein
MYDRNHFLLTIGGGLVSGAEEWQTGVRFAPATPASVDQVLDALDEISVEDIFNDFAPVIGNTDANLAYYKSLTLAWAKLAPIGTNGQYIGAPKSWSGNVVGGNPSAGTSVPQLAIVVSLLTGQSFGTAQRGRMYWPCPGQLPNTLDGLTGSFSEALSNQFAVMVATALLAAEGEVNTVALPAFAAVMSKSGGVNAPTAPGTTNAITEVGVGRIIDTQRRRRNQLSEVFIAQPALRGTRDTLTPKPRSGSADAAKRASKPST